MARRRRRRHNMSPQTREMPRVKLTVDQMIEHAQTSADDAIARVNTLAYYLTMISKKTKVRIHGTQIIKADLEEIYSLLDDLKEE